MVVDLATGAVVYEGLFATQGESNTRYNTDEYKSTKMVLRKVPRTADSATLPNGWGLYDMCGNLFEWVLDDYGVGNMNSRPDAFTPAYKASATQQMVKGGGCFGNGAASTLFRSSDATNRAPSTQGDYLGFRVALMSGKSSR